MRWLVPSRKANDVPWLDEAAQLIPHRDGDAAALIRHSARAHLVPVLCLRHPTCACTAKFSKISTVKKLLKTHTSTALHDGRCVKNQRYKNKATDVERNVRRVIHEC